MSFLRLSFAGARLMVLAGFALVLATCSARPGVLTRVATLGELRVATVKAVGSYYVDADGPTGFEYDLVRAFTDRLDLDLDLTVLADRHAVAEAVADGRVQLGVGLAVSDARRARVRFTPPYVRAPLEAVYRVGEDKPERLSDLSGQLTVPADAALADWLVQAHPDIAFEAANKVNAEQLLDRVASGSLDATVANANLVAINQRYHPNLRVAFKLPNVHRRLAWVFPPRSDSDDDGIYNKAIAFLEHSKHTDRLRVLRDRYFGHAKQLGFAGGHEFARQVDARLGRWRADFLRAGNRYDLDWRLLAAIGYQESRWNKDAVSPTTVRGIMMLTRAAAKEVHVDDRRNPQQSINGGARYFLRMRERLPAAIEAPDRTWFALAAYNLGFGHVMDARRLLAARGRDPNRWVNLRDALPWLTEKHYLDETSYGYARGDVAATYVDNIRAYYDILAWMHADTADLDIPDALARALTEDSGADAPRTLSIDSPAF